MCYYLDVIPSPDGNLLAVIISDDFVTKKNLFSNSTDKFTYNIIMHFVKSQDLLTKSQLVHACSPKIVRLDSKTNSVKFGYKWLPDSDGFVYVTAGNNQTLNAIKFSVDGSHPILSNCEPSSGFDCECTESPTTSGVFRQSDGKSAEISGNFDKKKSFNCGRS